MRLALGAFDNTRSALDVGTQMIQLGCLANQITIVSKEADSVGVVTEKRCINASFALLGASNGFCFWGIQQAGLYQGGIKEPREMVLTAMKIIQQFDEFCAQHSGASIENYLAIYPLLLLLQLPRNSDESISLSKALLHHSPNKFHALYLGLVQVS